MKPCLLFVGLLLAGGPAVAQAAAGPGPAPLPVAPQVVAPAAPDTLAAIHCLFAARRQRRNLLAVGAVGAAMVATAATPAPPDKLLTTSDYAKIYGLMAAVFIVADVLIGDDYSRKEERLAIESFQNHQLSPHLKHRLKARYFR